MLMTDVPLSMFQSQNKSQYTDLTWAGSSVGIETGYGLDGPGMESWWGRYFPPVQTGPGAHPASCKIGTLSFPGVKCGCWRLTPSSVAVMEEWSCTSTHPLGHTGPVMGSLFYTDLIKYTAYSCSQKHHIQYISITQVALYISTGYWHPQILLHTHVTRAGLFVKRQVKYVTSEGCGLKSQGHFQAANIMNSDRLGEDFQLQYSYVTSIRCVCVSRYRATDMWFSLYWKQLNTTYEVGQNRQRVAA